MCGVVGAGGLREWGKGELSGARSSTIVEIHRRHITLWGDLALISRSIQVDRYLSIACFPLLFFLSRVRLSSGIAKGLAGLLLFGGGLSVIAQTAPAGVAGRAVEISVANFVERSWLVDEGLPHNVVNRVVQGGAGYLWIATGAGLTRFDGRDFKLLPLPFRPAGGNTNIRDLAVEGPSSLLMLPASGGVVRYREGVFEKDPVSAQVEGRSLVDLFVEPDGVVWLGAENDTVMRWDGVKLITFGAKDGLNRRGNRFSFARDRDGRVWVAGGDFVGSYRDGHLEPLLPGPWNSAVIAPARSGGIWISTFERLLKWEDGKLTVVADTPDWPVARGTVNYLFEDRSGGLWMATRRDGLFRLAAGKISRVSTAIPMIVSVGEDREGNVWVSTEGGGIERLRPKEFVLLDHAAGLGEDVSTSVCVDAQGAIWCANRNGGLVRCHDGTAETIAASAVGTEFFAISTCWDRDNHVWVAMAGGLFRVPVTPPYDLEKMSPEIGLARVLFCARSGDMWVGAGNGGLGFFHDGKYTEISPAHGSAEQRVAAIAEAPDGGIWIASRAGVLSEYRDGKLVPQLSHDSTATGSIHTLLFDRAGALWIGTPEGLSLMKEGKLARLTKADGLPDDYIDQIAEDDRERLWIGSRSGLYCVSIAQLKARAAGRGPPVIGTKFGKDEGLVGATSISGEQPGTSKSTDGHLWFTTHRGIIGFDPARLTEVRPSPSVIIDEIRIDGRVTDRTVIIPPGDHRLDFHFVALNFSAPERVRVRHQLVGIDRDWIETVNEHVATYPQLPPGHYQMRVIACNQDGVWSDQPAVIDVVATAAWWQTIWWRVAILIGSAGLIVWLARLWSHRRLQNRLEQLERENALERERARIARDLHDELGGSLTQIRLLAERIKRHTAQPEFKDFAGQLAWRARRLGGELESIIWTVSPKNNTWDRLALFISQYALKFFRETEISCSVSGSDRISSERLRPEEQHNLLAVTKEALNNILKHSHAKNAIVEMSEVDGDFLLRIHDDGLGFDPARRELTTCNGLNNMRARLREIGGEIRVDTTPGLGTTITVRHRMNAPRITTRPLQSVI
jgi:signal transduction histidine kinase/ligand-binding sensor domain-containing protein